MSAKRGFLPRSDDAIMFAVTIDDHYDRLEFLNGWIHGDCDQWKDDFMKWYQEEKERNKG